MEKATLAFSILIQQRERNKAIGIANDTQMLRGLSAYGRSENKAQGKSDIQALVKASWLKAMIEEHQALAIRLTEYITANIEDADTRNEGIYVMTKLESYITHLGAELEVLL